MNCLKPAGWGGGGGKKKKEKTTKTRWGGGGGEEHNSKMKVHYLVGLSVDKNFQRYEQPIPSLTFHLVPYRPELEVDASGTVTRDTKLKAE